MATPWAGATEVSYEDSGRSPQDANCSYPAPFTASSSTRRQDGQRLSPMPPTLPDATIRNLTTNSSNPSPTLLSGSSPDHQHSRPTAFSNSQPLRTSATATGRSSIEGRGGRAARGAPLQRLSRCSQEAGGGILVEHTFSLGALEKVFGKKLDPNLAFEVGKLVSFGGCERLLRAMRLNRVLFFFGQVLYSSAGSAKTFAMSEPVDKIDAFISHNWSVSRFRKFIALTYHSNFLGALVCQVIITAAAGALGAEGYLPMVETVYGARGVVCTAISVPMFFLALFYGRDLLSLLGLYVGPRVFLDKTCINQVDEEEKMKAINKLGAFIFHSRQMIVLYSDVYLLKLWTVYEVACFLAMNDIAKMTVIPTSQAVFFCAALIFVYISSLMLLLIRAYSGFAQAHLVIAALAGCIYTLVLRKWARERHAIQKRLETFDCRSCVCFHESDRPLVYGNIASLMRASGRVQPIAREEEALEAFNLMVRERLPEAFASNQAKLGSFRYHHYFVLAFAANGASMFDYLAGFSEGAWQDGLSDFLVDCVWVTMLWPILFLTVETLTSKFTQLNGFRERIYFLAIYGLGTAIPASAAYALLREIWSLAAKPGTKGTVCLISLMVTSVVGGLATFSWHSGTWCGFRCYSEDDILEAGEEEEDDEREVEAEEPPSELESRSKSKESGFMADLLSAQSHSTSFNHTHAATPQEFRDQYFGTPSQDMQGMLSGFSSDEWNPCVMSIFV